VVDHLASQGSLTYDPVHALLYAVNAGSNTISVFAVAGDRLFLRQVIGSGGVFPVSVAVHGDLVYALNALTVEDLTPEMRAEFIALYRRWRAQADRNGDLG
jgi:DNA-binding beta-propeller fold protein YncE